MSRAADAQGSMPTMGLRVWQKPRQDASYLCNDPNGISRMVTDKERSPNEKANPIIDMTFVVPIVTGALSFSASGR